MEQACQYFGGREDAGAEGSFWMQFQDPARPKLLGDQLKQVAELHRLSRPAMEDLCVALWPDALLPTSFFGLVQQLQGAVPQVEPWKCSAYLEGAREAYAAVKRH